MLKELLKCHDFKLAIEYSEWQDILDTQGYEVAVALREHFAATEQYEKAAQLRDFLEIKSKEDGNL